MNGLIDSAVSAVARATDADLARLYVRLLKFAVRLQGGRQDADDLASRAFAKCLKRGIAEWHYAAVVLKNEYLAERMRVGRAKVVGISDLGDGSGTLEDIATSLNRVEAPNQEGAMAVRRICEAIDALPPRMAAVMRLRAQEWTVEEIAETLALTVSAVKGICERAKRPLRTTLQHTADNWKTNYRGVQKRGARFIAKLNITVGGKLVSKHVGTFSSALEAAQAYDNAAIAYGGERLKLNFPEAP